jgi:L-amino acid N-acyltransferase YncA
MRNIKLNNAEKADLPKLCEIYRQSVLNDTASWEYDAPDIKEFTKRFENIVQNGFPYIVAKIGGELAGFAYVGPYRARIGYRFCVEDSIYVAKAFQGKGVASALLGQLIHRCQSLGFKQMIAVIGDSENIASQRLHEKLGFIKVGLLPKIGFKFDKWLDSVIMQKSLDE